MAALLPLVADGQIKKLSDTDAQKLVKSGTAPDVQQAIQNGSLDAKGTSGNGYPWIVWAALHNPNASVISLLLEAGADVEAESSKYGTRALGVAAWNNTPDVVAVLLKAGAHVNFANRYGVTPLMAAADHNPNAKEVIALLLSAGADINGKDFQGYSALDYAKHDPRISGAQYFSKTTDPAIYYQLLVAATQTQTEPPDATVASLELRELSIDDIYPVFHNYYDTHPLGTVVLQNTTGWPITGIKVSFQIKEFMTDPKDCSAPAELGPRDSKTVDLFGLFLPTILQTTEKTKTQARVDVEYTFNGQVQHQSLVESITILNRNATSWADDKRAAAFVTVRDPVVLAFSKNVNSIIKGKIQGDPNLLAAIAFFQALQLYGLTYSQDPIPTRTANNQVADFIQFPRETLLYKGGKCSDFSVLYSAFLESVGIETAFITIPGHIFIAFSTGAGPDEAKKIFSSRANDLIVHDNKSWIPVEVTETAGFLQAWQDAAKEWRENTAGNQAAFYPLHDAWQLYEPVALPGAETLVDLPPSEQIVSATQKEVGKFIDQEIFTKVAELESQIVKAQDPRKPTNELGVLYARYGQYDRARKEFQKLLAKEEYVPALLNMGNIFYLSDQKGKALELYNRAYAKDPGNPRVILAVAKANQDLGNYGTVKKLYAELKAKDLEIAQQFAYLDLKEDDATRASNAAAVKVVWE